MALPVMLEAKLWMALALHTPLSTVTGALRNALHTPGMIAPTVPHRLPRTSFRPLLLNDQIPEKVRNLFLYHQTRVGGRREISFESSSTVV